jgi:eukaryotic-like serine/threonine-protein kinase
MDPERWEEIKRIYNLALQCEPDEQEGFLKEVCSGDDSLRKEVETLLAHQRKADGFMKVPAMEVAAHVMAQDQGKSKVENLAGRSVAHYHIMEKIGEGGMGVVYRAKDTRLDRHVAIKSLPDIFAADPVRLARFEREAKILATLNHRNIASVYGLEESEGQRFLVMELVEGKTLAKRLIKGRIPLDESLEICRQIAAGLEAAHEKGIIHRDLKPSNIKLTPEGKVKILDFGLAKAFHPERGAEDLSQPHTDADSMTDTGVILGTAAYMSPEQAKGKQLDRRTDIWAFGCILFECLAGKRAFPGDTISETLAAVIKEEPDWTALPKGTPEKTCELLKRCLNKDADRRLHDIADARIEVEESGAEAPMAARKRTPLRIRIIVAAAIVVVAVGMAALGRLWINRPRSYTQVPLAAVPIFTESGMVGHPTFSPDGGDIAFSWNGEKQDNMDIYRRPIAGGTPRRLTTDPRNDYQPTWSPNGRSIAFFRIMGEQKQAVYLVSTESSVERKLTEISKCANFSPNLEWSRDSRWLVVTYSCQLDRQNGLYLLSIDSGEKKRLTTAPAGTAGDYLPALSPDGQTLAFVRRINYGICEVYRVSLTGDFQPKGEPERLKLEQNKMIHDLVWTPDGRDILYASGYLFAGERVLQRIKISEPKGESGYSTNQELLGEGAGDLAISPNGRGLAYARFSRDSDIYRFELPDKYGRIKNPQKFIASKRPDYGAEYSPDGQKIAFGSIRSGTEEIWICNTDGLKPRQLTSMGGPQTANPRWSPNGEWIVFDSRKEGSADLYLISIDGSSQRRLTSDPGYEGEARWSRDGKWIYFHSNRTGGRSQVYKIAAAGGEAIQITKYGGSSAFESPDGRWLYYSKILNNQLDQLAIWRIPLEGGPESQVHDGPLSYNYNFVVVEEGLYFTKRDDSLEFFDFTTGISKTLAKLEGVGPKGGMRSYGLTISPDHRWILYSKVEKPYTDLMLVENFR